MNKIHQTRENEYEILKRNNFSKKIGAFFDVVEECYDSMTVSEINSIFELNKTVYMIAMNITEGEEFEKIKEKFYKLFPEQIKKQKELILKSDVFEESMKNLGFAITMGAVKDAVGMNYASERDQENATRWLDSDEADWYSDGLSRSAAIKIRENKEKVKEDIKNMEEKEE